MGSPAASRELTRNLFLDNLSDASAARIAPFLELVTIRRGELLYGIGEPMARVLFPIGGVVSVVTEMSDGATVEVGFIGYEGMTGIAVALGNRVAGQRALVQIPDSAMSINTVDFEECLHSDPELLAASLQYTQATISSLAQFAACNRLHPVPERCARWLLMAHDRVPTDDIALTQQFLSHMLGVRRAGVTVAAGTLQRAGFIEYGRGQVRVLDRAGLESASCECYFTVERDWETVMHYSIRKRATGTGRPMPG